MAQCDPVTTTIWVNLAWREWVALCNPLCSSPGWGAQGLVRLQPPTLRVGSGVLFFTVVLPWGQPKTAWLAHVSW